MKKKIFLRVLCCGLLIGLSTGCGNSNETLNNKSNNNIETNNSESSKEFSYSMKFMGYNIPCKSKPTILDSRYVRDVDYGYFLGFDDFIVVVGAPSIAGIMLNLNNIEEAPSKTNEYLFKTLEHEMRSKFDFDTTTNTISKQEIKTINGISMLRTAGTLNNSDNNTSYEYVAYYLMVKNRPIYFVGIPDNNANKSVSEFMDNYAKSITKQ